ncbi:hypothetical protein ACFY7H_21925 [Streptomyces sp. NPDC012794]|uniref:hypothetical protein n=1 Tax=Streptomyces sp. NPDC012794 TaxID=3364850 RepID=UPI003687DEC8
MSTMNAAPTYGLSTGTPQWALDPYRFPGLHDMDEPEAPAGPGADPSESSEPSGPSGPSEPFRPSGR